jgi:hypothetical protein
MNNHHSKLKLRASRFKDFINESNDFGDCYEASGRLILFDSGQIDPYGELYLVHGMVDGQGGLSGVRFDHAWCEDDHLVYDFSNGRKLILPKEYYYRVGNITDSENFKYSVDQAREFILNTGNWGPWERTFESLYPQYLNSLNENLYRQLISNGIDDALQVFMDAPNIGSQSIIKIIKVDGVRLKVIDTGRVVTLFDEDKNLLSRLFYEINDEDKIDIGFINSFKPGEGYSKILMLYLSSKYGYQNIDRDILTDYGQDMRHELDRFFKTNNDETESYS